MNILKIFLTLAVCLVLSGCATASLLEMQMKAPKGTHYDWETGSYQKD